MIIPRMNNIQYFAKIQVLFFCFIFQILSYYEPAIICSKETPIGFHWSFFSLGVCKLCL